MTNVFSGMCGLIWYCFWLWLAFEKPSKHPCISARELRYIEDSLGQGQTQMAMPTFATTPWRKFLTSMPVHAIIVANFCRSWNFYLLVLFQARFMHEAFGMALLEVSSIRTIIFQKFFLKLKKEGVFINCFINQWKKKKN